MAAAKAIKAKVPGVYPIGYTGLSEHMYLPTIWQAGGQIATQDGDTWKSALNSPQAAKAIEYYTDFYKEGLDPKAAIGWEEPDAQTAFINGDIAMLIGGGWTYNSIIAHQAGARGARSAPRSSRPARAARTPRSRAAATSCSSRSPRTRTSANAFVDFMLEPATAEQVHAARSASCRARRTASRRRATSTTRVRKPFAEQLLDHSAVYPPSPQVGRRWRARTSSTVRSRRS